MSELKIPPTRTHRQLAAWINASRLSERATGRPVKARVEPAYTNTDTKIAGTRFIHKGRGRFGLRLAILQHDDINREIYSHNSSGTYRRHAEARMWCSRNLTKRKP